MQFFDERLLEMVMANYRELKVSFRDIWTGIIRYRIILQLIHQCYKIFKSLGSNQERLLMLSKS